MDLPLVSVIIASKNTARYFEKCLLSIKSQTYKNIEIIVVDNFSTDGTLEIAKKYADQAFSLGPERCTQFNFGFKQSRGEYIYRIGPDYILEQDVVEKCVNKIQEGFDALALHNRSVGESIWAKVRFLERESYRNDKTVVAVRFFKRQVFQDVGMFDEKLVANEDFDLHYRIDKAGYRWGHVDAIENHIGEPENIFQVWQKFFYYGRTMPNYINKNKTQAKEKVILFRPSFKKFYKQLFLKPKLFLAFHVYFLVKAVAGVCGYLAGTPPSLKESRQVAEASKNLVL
jgi:glycosyltransferase involved in cell wall biosynthesis